MSDEYKNILSDLDDLGLLGTVHVSNLPEGAKVRIYCYKEGELVHVGYPEWESYSENLIHEYEAVKDSDTTEYHIDSAKYKSARVIIDHPNYLDDSTYINEVKPEITEIKYGRIERLEPNYDYASLYPSTMPSDSFKMYDAEVAEGITKSGQEAMKDISDKLYESRIEHKKKRR